MEMILIKNLNEKQWKMINSNYGDGSLINTRFHVVKGEPKRGSLLRGFLLKNKKIITSKESVR